MKAVTSTLILVRIMSSLEIPDPYPARRQESNCKLPPGLEVNRTTVTLVGRIQSHSNAFFVIRPLRQRQDFM